MDNSTKSKIEQIMMLTLGYLVDLKERISSILERKSGEAEIKIEDLEEKHRGYDGSILGDENTPERRVGIYGQRPSQINQTDVILSENVDDQPTFLDDPVQISPSDLTEKDTQFGQEVIDPSMEENIPLRPSEFEIPDEIQYDKEDDLGVPTPGQNNEAPEVEAPEFETPEKSPEIVKPTENRPKFDIHQKKGDYRKKR